MNPYLAEFLGTAMLLLLGNGVVCNVVLARTKGHGSGWLVITTGWGLAVYVAVFCMAPHSGAHLNPAVSVGLAAAGEFAWDRVPGFVLAQLAGAFTGACLAWLMHRRHYDATGDADAKLATFCTSAAIPGAGSAFLSEVAGTFMLVFPVLCIVEPSIALDGTDVPIGLGALGALPVALVVFAVGLGLGGPTGFAINPARDLGPRIAHHLLPIAGKRDSNWRYAWIPVAGPIAGALLAAAIGAVI